MRERAAALHDHLDERFGDDLRSVIAYDADGYAVEYVRPDVREQYDEGGLENAMQHARIEALGDRWRGNRTAATTAT